jgi:hypothetical protein
MKCLSCDKNLTDFESTRKYSSTGGFVDLCNYCFGSVSDQINTTVRSDLAHEEDTEGENDSYLDFDIDKEY